MANRSKKRKAARQDTSDYLSESRGSLLGIWTPVLLAIATFLVYLPSLRFDFVYDAHLEIEEGFITSLSNLPAVLSLKVLGMNLILGDRPGQMLYLMLVAAIWGKDPFGYHLCSNLLHAANVALLFMLLSRLIANEVTGLAQRKDALKVQVALVAVTLIFALHPIAVESVSEVSYSSSLLVTFFTLAALLAATSFRPENFQAAMITGGLGVFCTFASVTSKESGIATAFLLIVYWFLFRRREAKRPWFFFLSVAIAVSVAFLAARFLLAPPPTSTPVPLTYLGGSFFQVFLIQPRLWVFMMGKLLWPVQLSADYIPVEEMGPSTFLALMILIVVFLLQAGLAYKSQVGALGVAIYWFGLATVSNFIPLYRPLADRYYYLPMMGVSMQLIALLLMTVRSRQDFWMLSLPCLGAILPLTLLTLTRENVFASDFSLWSDTLQASPLSGTAHNSFAVSLLQKGQLDEAIIQFQKVLEVNPDFAEAHNNLGIALFQRGQVDEAMVQFQEAVQLKPDYSDAQYNLDKAKDIMAQRAIQK